MQKFINLGSYSPNFIPSPGAGIDDTLFIPLSSDDCEHYNRGSKQEYFHALLGQHALWRYFLESLTITPGPICLCAVHILVGSRGSPLLQQHDQNIQIAGHSLIMQAMKNLPEVYVMPDTFVCVSLPEGVPTARAFRIS